MNYSSIRIEGSILSPDFASRIEQLPGQRPVDFGFNNGIKIKDEIARAWIDAQHYWQIFQRKLESLKPGTNATTETRNHWIIPLLGLLRYDIEYQSRGIEYNGKTYPISHRVTNRGNVILHITGYRDPAGLDKKPSNTNRRMSAHALVQECLNLNDQLYGLVTDGHVIRLLRNSSRLIRQSYLEFDLDRIFSDSLFADFAILYRLLHVTRLPLTQDTANESLIEQYHQDSLDSGARIRNGLSSAVERAIRDFGTGFLVHPQNAALRTAVVKGDLHSLDYYKYLLRLIYRLLFLIVIEERDLIFPSETPKIKRDIYYNFYSVERLRLLSEKRHLYDFRRHDFWLALTTNFRLFEADGPGFKLGIAPLAGELFHEESIGPLINCTLGNDVLLGCLRSLTIFQHPDNRQLIRVNYASLNVEEFGSVYEGLLEYDPEFIIDGTRIEFGFKQGNERAATGSHYTPENLVQPLIQYSLDYLIEERRKANNPEAALLDLRVADIACGSGHILLAAARRIATVLAIVRTGEEQPSPLAYRIALRDVICNCIYGVDLNPLAVELCKVALWLEAHNPGQPLNFLDHHIKCGNALIGYTNCEEVSMGVPNEAFKTLPEDDKEVVKRLRKKNGNERDNKKQMYMDFVSEVRERFDSILQEHSAIARLPEKNAAQIENKKNRFTALAASREAWLLKQIAAIPIAQFFIPKTKANESKLITDAQFCNYWRGEKKPQGEKSTMAWNTANHMRFFHWFLEFPDIIARGGFDCILGNPPYLGEHALSGTYGHPFCEYLKWKYAPTGLSDLVVFFLRRVFQLIRPGGFTSLITTNSIIDGDIRKHGLAQVVIEGGQINMAISAAKWLGRANIVVSLMTLHKGEWDGPRFLNGNSTSWINSRFEEGEEQNDPQSLLMNHSNMFQGSCFLGNGFILSHKDADRLRASDKRNTEVIMPLINGKELNNEPEQQPGRCIINFRDWSMDRAQKYPTPFAIVQETVKPFRAKQNRKRNRDVWWLYAENRPGLNRKLCNLSRCFAVARTTKYLNFSAMPTNIVFSDAVQILTTERWDIFAVVQSTIHEVWARKYSGSLKQDLRYSHTNCFVTFPFPNSLWQTPQIRLAEIGERFHEHRKTLMHSLWLGLTEIYNLLHTHDLTPRLVAKVSNKDVATANAGYEGLLKLRRLHVELDNAVRDAYGWQDLDLEHGFHEMEILSENDRIRYTLNRAARREILKRLLAFNHACAVIEANATITSKQGRKKSNKIDGAVDTFDLFRLEA